MKTVIKNIWEKYTLGKLLYPVSFILALAFTSCEAHVYIEDEYPGDAYIALSWTGDEPDVIDPGTNAIPNTFYWDRYYFIRPGIYTLYYDGEYNNGNGFVEYAWEVDYEIYVNWSDEVDYYEDVDNYFVLECHPLGPDVFLDYKSSNINDGNIKSEFVVVKKNKNYSMKTTYRKVEKRVRN